jgi:5-methylcytosine-specific restriction protein A
VLVSAGLGRCDVHRSEQRQHEDARRGNANARGYNTRWQKARATWLRRHPLCNRCDQLGKVVAATVVDHIIAHEGDQDLFWDTGNWQSLCQPCHDGWKQAQEAAGRKVHRGGGGQKSKP